jgi:hypothetical protein
MESKVSCRKPLAYWSRLKNAGHQKDFVFILKCKILSSVYRKYSPVLFLFSWAMGELKTGQI